MKRDMVFDLAARLRMRGLDKPLRRLDPLDRRSGVSRERVSARR